MSGRRWQVVDLAAVPAGFRRVRVEMNEEEWQEIGRFLDEHGTPAVAAPWTVCEHDKVVEPDTMQIEIALQNGESVPGIRSLENDIQVSRIGSIEVSRLEGEKDAV